MKSVKDVLDDAVRDYNRTMHGWNSQFHENASLTERRGIFYNALRRQFQYNFSSFNFTNRIPVDTISLELSETKVIRKVKINTKPRWSDNEDDVKILNEIDKLCPLEYLDTEVYINFDNIKNFSFKF